MPKIKELWDPTKIPNDIIHIVQTEETCLEV